MQPLRRALLAPTLAIAAVLVLAAPGAAHVDPGVTEVPAGSLGTVTFTVEHGCEGSPTEKLEFQMPAGVTDVAPVEKAGWTASVAGDVVTFVGSLPDAEEGEFALTFTVPDTVGDIVRFPLIQTCTEGELSWIGTDPESDNPAPAVTVSAADPSAPVPSTTEPPASTTTEAASTTETTAVDESTTTISTAGDGATTTTQPAADGTDDDDDGFPVWIPVTLVVGAVCGVGAVMVLRRRGQA